MARVAVIGAGVAGLGAALMLGHDGHQVVVLERDRTPLPSSADEAFWWDRRGAPQVRHSHALLALLRNLLRDHLPEVLTDLFAAGATELRFTDNLPATLDDPSPKPGDEDLVALACRRTTFEWVLRRAALATGGVEFHTGSAVTGLVADLEGPVPVVTGVVVGEDVVAADTVVDAGGRRSALPRLFGEAGMGELPETTEDTGIVYFSRFYRLHEGADEPVVEGPIGGDLGYLKYAVFKGDNRTFSVTLAVNTVDSELRGAVLRPENFEVVARVLPPTKPWVERAEPITGVEAMAGLINRIREFVADGRPRALGVHAIGDASVCTNPLYGRGCALGMVHAHLFADALREHGPGGEEVTLALADATARDLAPWYRSSVMQDRFNSQRARGEEGSGEDQQAFLRSVFAEGLRPATRTDAVVFRAFLRVMNLLDSPDRLMTDPDLLNRVMRVYQDRDNRPPEPALGPARDELLSRLPADVS